MKAVLSLKLGGCYFLDFFLVGSGLSYFWVILFSHPVMPTTAWVGTGFFVDWEDPPPGQEGGKGGVVLGQDSPRAGFWCKVRTILGNAFKGPNFGAAPLGGRSSARLGEWGTPRGAFKRSPTREGQV